MAIFGNDFEKEAKKRLAWLEREVAVLKEVVARLQSQVLSGGQLQEDFSEFANAHSCQAQQLERTSYGPAFSGDLVEVGKLNDGETGKFRERIAELEPEIDQLRFKAAGVEKAQEENEELTRQLKKAAADLAQARAEKTNLDDKIWKVQRQLEEALKSCSSLERDNARLAQEVRNNEADLSAARSGLEAAQMKARQLESDLAAISARQLKDQASLFEIQEFLVRLSPSARALLRPYYDCASLAAFLAQCGQFSRLSQVWEACGKVVANGGEAGELARILEKLLELYNLAAGDSPAQAISATPGEPYKSGLHFRVRSDGSRVARELLPGLRNAGGKTVQQVLVVLE